MSFDPEDYARAVGQVLQGRGKEEFNPPDTQKLGRFTVMCLIMNRSIGQLLHVIERPYSLPVMPKLTDRTS